MLASSLSAGERRNGNGSKNCEYGNNDNKFDQREAFIFARFAAEDALGAGLAGDRPSADSLD